MHSTISNTVINNEALKGVAPQVTSAIKSASARTGIDFSYLMNQAKAESNFDPSAKAGTSSATGLYQFIESTWLQMVKDHGAEYGLEKEAAAITKKSNGQLTVSSPSMRKAILDLRKDPELASAMAAEFANGNKEYLEMRVKGRDIEATELYFAHFLGAGGASRFLNKLDANPHAIAAHSFPKAAQANRNVFYDVRSGQPRTMQQVYDFFDKKFSTDYGDVQMAAQNSKNLAPDNKGGIAMSGMNVFRAAGLQNSTPHTLGAGSFMGLATDIQDSNELYLSALMAMPAPMEEQNTSNHPDSRSNEKPKDINFLGHRLQNPAILQLLKV